MLFRSRPLEEMAAALRARGFTRVRVECSLSLTAFVDAIAAAPLVVSTETAAAHLATVLDRPTLVIMGGGHFGQFGPWRRSPRQIWLTHPMECFGCNWHCIHSRPHCLTDVPPEAIANAISSLLARKEAP